MAKVSIRYALDLNDYPRSLLVDENDVFRAGRRECLEAEEIEVLGETDDPETAWTLIETDPLSWLDLRKLHGSNHDTCHWEWPAGFGILFPG